TRRERVSSPPPRGCRPPLTAVRSPERVWEGEAGERVDRERLGRREAVALDEDVELAQVLRGMPGRALEEVVPRLRAVVDTDHALELRRRSALEPAADPGAH